MAGLIAQVTHDDVLVALIAAMGLMGSAWITTLHGLKRNRTMIEDRHSDNLDVLERMAQALQRMQAELSAVREAVELLHAHFIAHVEFMDEQATNQLEQPHGGDEP